MLVLVRSTSLNKLVAPEHVGKTDSFIGSPQLWRGIGDDIINPSNEVSSPKSRFELLILGERAARGRLRIPGQLDGIVKESGQVTQAEVSIDVSLTSPPFLFLAFPCSSSNI